MFGTNLKVLVAMVTELCTHSMRLRFASYIPVLILKNKRHTFSQTNNFSQIIKFSVSRVYQVQINLNAELFLTSEIPLFKIAYLVDQHSKSH